MHCTRAGRRFVRTRPNQYPRGSHRRQLITGKKMGLDVGKTKRGKGTKIMVITGAYGFSVAANIERASFNEVKLVEKTIDSGFTKYTLNKIIGDKGYDSDKLDQRFLDERNVKLIALHRKGQKNQRTQGSGEIRPYRRKWKIEQLFAWFQKIRHIVARYEYHADKFLGMVQLGCLIIKHIFF